MKNLFVTFDDNVAFDETRPALGRPLVEQWASGEVSSLYRRSGSGRAGARNNFGPL